MEFDGQQTGEHILSIITPHKSKAVLSVSITFLSIFAIGAFLFGIASFFPQQTNILRLLMMVFLILGTLVSLWWIWLADTKDKTYITDRRIIRFDVVSPFFTNKRALFFNEILKVKAYAPNMIMRLLKVGTLQIEPVAAEQESIIITSVYYHEDLANYIDKILFAFKNKPSDIASIKPFIPLPKGKRG